MLTLLPTFCSNIFASVSSLFVTTDVSKYKIRNKEKNEDYISMLNGILEGLIFNGKAKTKLAMLILLYCEKL